MGNKRSFFRITVDSEPVKIFYFENGGKQMRMARLRDISAGGISVFTDKDVILTKESNPYTIQFELFKTSMKCTANLVRLEDHKKSFVYGFKFIDITDKFRSELAAKMLKMDIKKRML